MLSREAFQAQFNRSEWEILCENRIFLLFLDRDIKMAARIAAERLRRAVRYNSSKNRTLLGSSKQSVMVPPEQKGA